MAEIWPIRLPYATQQKEGIGTVKVGAPPKGPSDLSSHCVSTLYRSTGAESNHVAFGFGIYVPVTVFKAARNPCRMLLGPVSTPSKPRHPQAINIAHKSPELNI